MIDLFWEQPFAFAIFVHHRYRAELIDAFAGRVYETEHQPSTAILQFRKLLKRERDYDHPDDYSIPIGSRYHPERAALWAPDSPVETTEEWIEEAAGSSRRNSPAPDNFNQRQPHMEIPQKLKDYINESRAPLPPVS